MSLLLLSTPLFPVERSLRESWRLGQGSQRINVKIWLGRVWFLKIIARLYLHIALGQDGLQFGEDLFQLLARKLSAKPEDKARYFVHGGWSPGCHQTTTALFVDQQTLPPFDFRLKHLSSPQRKIPELCKLPLRRRAIYPEQRWNSGGDNSDDHRLSENQSLRGFITNTIRQYDHRRKGSSYEPNGIIEGYGQSLAADRLPVCAAVHGAASV
jgi:hypothetical protein